VRPEELSQLSLSLQDQNLPENFLDFDYWPVIRGDLEDANSLQQLSEL
jgi:hypothetical protein